MDKKIIMVNLLTNVFISVVYILQIQEIEIASDTKNLLQFIIIQTVDMNIVYTYVLNLQNMWFINENVM